MKKNSIILAFFFSALISCNKDKLDNTPEKVGISKVTHFPILTMSGESVMAVANGETFTDPGVTAKVGDADAPVATSGTVNTSQDGVYTISYSATNSDGFSATLYRTVAVYTTDAGAAAHDLSGSYLRGATGVLSTWDKLAPGTYLVTNPGGAASGAGLTIVVFNPTGYTIHAPAQRSSDGNTSSTSNETFTPGSPDMYSWVFLNPGYGTGSRSFVKQ
jgi:hypothetical protein